jgi:hypothetical protein
MTLQSWIIAGLLVGLCASLFLIATAQVSGANLPAIVIILGTIVLITLVRRFALSRIF